MHTLLFVCEFARIGIDTQHSYKSRAYIKGRPDGVADKREYYLLLLQRCGRKYVSRGSLHIRSGRRGDAEKYNNPAGAKECVCVGSVWKANVIYFCELLIAVAPIETERESSFRKYVHYLKRVKIFFFFFWLSTGIYKSSTIRSSLLIKL